MGINTTVDDASLLAFGFLGVLALSGVYIAKKL